MSRQYISKFLPAIFFFSFLFMSAGMVSSRAYGHAVKSSKELLRKSIDAVGLTKTAGKVLRMNFMESNLQNFQSDRTYEPYFSAMTTAEVWFDPAKILQRSHTNFVYPGVGPAPRLSMMVSDPQATFFVRDTAMIQVSNLSGPDRNLNPLWVLRVWETSSSIAQENDVLYRDYYRNVLVRKTETGDERLFLDSKTGFPVKLDYTEKHYLWGQVHVEYIYSNWNNVDDAYYPMSSFCMTDGSTLVSRTVGNIEFVSNDTLSVAMKSGIPSPQFDNSQMFLRPLPPDTIRITGSNNFLLKNRGYTEGVAFVEGSVFVFDATQGEKRAQEDEKIIQSLYPGEHPVFVVVTDLAWPHIAGVRYWISKGATIISHKISEQFLRSVLDRKWTLEPDILEQNRTKSKLKFIPVDSTRSFAGGKVQLYAIDGIGSEGALIAYLPESKFLWASDYIQDISAPTSYATEVWNRVTISGITPEYVAAEHLPLTQWSVVDSLCRK